MSLRRNILANYASQIYVTLIGIVTNVIITVWLLLYLAGRIFKVLGTTDTAMLSELKH